MKEPSPRLRRVNSTLLHAVAEIVHHLKDPRLEFVTITAVEATPDLRTAHVFYSVLGDDEARTEAAAGLEAASGHIRKEVGEQVRLKYTPRLVFEPDVGIEEGIKIDRLLRRLEDT